MPPKEITLNGYETRVKNIKTKSGLDPNTQPNEIVAWLKKQPLKESTKRTYIVAVIEVTKTPKLPETHPYRVYLDELWKLEHKESQNQTLTESEKAKFMSWDNLINNFYKLVRIVNANSKPGLTPDPATVRDAVLFGLYCKLDPVRADYGELQITITLKEEMKGMKKGNYLVTGYKSTGGKNMYVIVQNYKTDGARNAEPIKQRIPKDLRDMILIMIGERRSGYLFNKGGIVSEDKSEPMADKRFSEMMIDRMEKYTGKKVGINMYRHARITELLKDEKTTVQKAKISKNMGHTVATQEKYRRIDAK